MTHCWMGKYEYMESIGQLDDYLADGEQVPSTCLLPDGHAGPHEWTPDSEIIIQFKG